MISVIIVSYNTRDILRDCLQSVLREEISTEVVVVDNQSTDGTLEMIEKEFPSVKLLKNNYNAGFSAANNQGIAATSGKYILLLNPDTIVKKDAFVQMREKIIQDGNVILGPQLLNTDESLQISAWKFPTVFNSFLELFYLHRIFTVSGYPHEQFSTEFTCDFISGAAMFFERNKLEKLHGLDETLFWMEDVDLCYRAAKQGWKTVYFPEAKIIHLGGQSSSKNYKKAIANQLLSRLKFCKKNYSFLSFILLNVITFFHILSRCMVFSWVFIFNQTPKAGAYVYSFKRFFMYLFGNNSIA